MITKRIGMADTLLITPVELHDEAWYWPKHTLCSDTYMYVCRPKDSVWPREVWLMYRGMYMCVFCYLLQLSHDQSEHDNKLLCVL